MRGFRAVLIVATLLAGGVARADDMLGSITPPGNNAAADPSIDPSAAATADEGDGSSGSRFGGQVYRALSEGAPEAAGAYMRDAINSLGGICTNTSAFQRVGPKSKLLTYKVRCGSKPLYLLTVEEHGRILADGGDGRVPAMRPDDGEIIDGKTGAPQTAESAAAAAQAPGNDQIPLDDVKKAGPVAVSSVGAPAGSGKKLRVVVAGFAIFLFFGTAVFVLVFSGRGGAAPKPSNAPKRYPSEMKDVMIAESSEIAPEVWAHRSGIFIVRGRHGKRRVFAYRWNAMLYHRWGYKILQLR